MTIEEYTSLISTATAENFQVVLTSVLENIKEDTTAAESLKETIGMQETKIRDLQDTNHKLFLSQTSKVAAPEAEKDIDDELAEIKASHKGIDAFL